MNDKMRYFLRSLHGLPEVSRNRKNFSLARHHRRTDNKIFKTKWLRVIKMIANPFKTFLNKRKVYIFILCLSLSEIQSSQGSQNNKLPVFALTEGALTDERSTEVHPLEIIFGAEKNKTRPWVPKCCSLNYGFTFENKSLCVETENEFLPDFEDWPEYSKIAKNLPVKTRYEYFIGDPCLDGKYILDLTAYPDDQYSIFTNGTLLYLNDWFTKEEYCLETLNESVRAFICFRAGKPEVELDFTYIIYAIGLLISIPFLLATAFVYLCIDMFRDLRGKCLSCHVLCLAVGYLVLATVQLASNQLNEGLCISAGFIIQFFFVASFFWLNLICYDTWRCIKNDFQCILSPTNPRSEKIKFCCYSLYGWYGPIILSIATLVMDLEPAIPESYLKPNFGLRSCWFYSDDAALPYFYGPVALIIIINIVFFFMSARKIFKEQSGRIECKARNRDSFDITGETNLSLRIYTEALKECIYLFCIMGINWAAEVISWAVGGSQMIWLVTDIFNAFQGIMIFYLFVIKPIRVRKELKSRISIFWKRIIKCDYEYKKENKRSSRHWHANFFYEDSQFQDETEKILFRPNTTAV